MRSWLHRRPVAECEHTDCPFETRLSGGEQDNTMLALHAVKKTGCGKDPWDRASSVGNTAISRGALPFAACAPGIPTRYFGNKQAERGSQYFLKR
jgi:hypothetical protein